MHEEMKKNNAEDLETERFTIAIPKLLVKKLIEEKEKRGYSNLQVIINEAIRERYFGMMRIAGMGIKKPYTGARRGPKPKFNHEDMVSGESVLFWDKGEKKKEKKKK